LTPVIADSYFDFERREGRRQRLGAPIRATPALVGSILRRRSLERAP